jgi:hypothetical protein
MRGEGSNAKIAIGWHREFPATRVPVDSCLPAVLSPQITFPKDYVKDRFHKEEKDERSRAKQRRLS